MVTILLLFVWPVFLFHYCETCFKWRRIFTRGLMLSMSQIGKQGSRIAIVEVDSQMAPATNTMWPSDRSRCQLVFTRRRWKKWQTINLRDRWNNCCQTGQKGEEGDVAVINTAHSLPDWRAEVTCPGISLRPPIFMKCQRMSAKYEVVNCERKMLYKQG